MTGDEEGFVWEGERMEVVDGERKEGRGGEDSGEAAPVDVSEGEDGVGEIREFGRSESRECRDDDCFFFFFHCMGS